MGLLGDAFPPELIRQRLEPGRILYLVDCKFTTPRKPKFVVLLCLDPEAWLFVISSRPAQFIKRQADLLRCQVLLCGSDYDCLSHDSYLDCSKAVKEMSLHEIEAQVSADVDRIKEMINEDSRRDIISAVRAAITLTTYEKKIILNNLSRL